MTHWMVVGLEVTFPIKDKFGYDFTLVFFALTI
ncbi:hypothetical protein C8P64_0878 [Christiangramia gaetbulicola]|uniref:Uncharacterized protein n=1 Tax=Christiangramia gaetbulicola TaxID=703340 RepID=A0A2T6AM45_9FLAO|nr:hypothetical protein C8P64_0878 [Christiangramia gaetbulicola]